MSRRVMFYVQHLLGVGHLKRASILAKAMAKAGLNVSVVLGGMDVPGVDFDGCARILLPPVRAADETFKTLVDDKGTPIDIAWQDNRLARLLTEFEALRPHVLLLEMFPFGRRRFGFELMPLLEAARAAQNRPRIVSSVRDVLVQEREAGRNREIASVVTAWFDRVLVHGDPKLIPLDDSFPEATAIADKLTYTGYVVADREFGDASLGRETGAGEVVVSVGGGAVGESLLRLALAARPLSLLADRPWRLIGGPNLNEAAYKDLAWDPPPGVIVERWRPDLPVLLRNCILPVSQGGYNTIVDILQANARAVIVPFAASNETEQTLRARALAARGLVTLVDSTELTPKRLAEAIDRAANSRPPRIAFDFSGAETSATIIAELCAAAASEQD